MIGCILPDCLPALANSILRLAEATVPNNTRHVTTEQRSSKVDCEAVVWLAYPTCKAADPLPVRVRLRNN